jgi:hypothetical protein
LHQAKLIIQLHQWLGLGWLGVLDTLNTQWVPAFVFEVVATFLFVVVATGAGCTYTSLAGLAIGRWLGSTPRWDQW